MVLLRCLALTVGLLSFVAPSEVWGREPRKQMLFIGGGGEGDNPENQFDNSLEAAVLMAQTNNWHVNAVYNFQHPSSAKKMRELGGSKQFTGKELSLQQVRRDLRALIRELEDPNSKWQRGDQLLVAIATHGTLDAEQNLVLRLGASRNDVGSISAELKTLVRLAPAKGVKLGLLLGSCYSGNGTAELGLDDTALDKVCVAETSTRGRLSYGNSADSLTANVQKAPDLETAFLSYRESPVFSTVPFFPQISTRAGRHALAETRSIDQYLYDSEDGSRVRSLPTCNNLNSPMFGSDLATLYLNRALRTERQQFWQTAFAKAKAVTTGQLPPEIEALNQRKSELDALNDELRPLMPFGLDAQECTARPMESSYLAAMTSRELVSQNPTKAKRIFCDNFFVLFNRDGWKELEKQLPNTIRGETDPAKRRELSDKLSEIRALITQGDKVAQIQTYKDLVDKTKARFPSKLVDRLMEIEQRDPAPMVQTERKIWRELYDSYGKTHPRAPNPCRDFKI